MLTCHRILNFPWEIFGDVFTITKGNGQIKQILLDDVGGAVFRGEKLLVV